jgi:PhzF family phenazine biosynthesis protein
MKIKVYQIDSFTNEKFRGNPACVVVNADSLSYNQMQDIARELNNSETAFLLKPDFEDHDFRIKFFTPTTEVPSCGHATIASHYVRAIEKNLKPGIYYHKIKVGTYPAELIKENDNYKIMMTQPKPEFLNLLNKKQKQILLSALNISSVDLIKNVPLQIVDTGHSKVMVPINSWDKLQEIEPDQNKLKELSKEIACNGYFVFTMDSRKKGFHIHGRMFAPAIGIKEDPVTGNANGPMGAYLVKYNLIKHNGKNVSIKSLQGEKIKREGTAYVEVLIENNEPLQVKVGGFATKVFATELEVN